jgi:hypothetical protein
MSKEIEAVSSMFQCLDFFLKRSFGLYNLSVVKINECIGFRMESDRFSLEYQLGLVRLVVD